MTRRLRILKAIHKYNSDELIHLALQPINEIRMGSMNRLTKVLSRLTPRLKERVKASVQQIEFDFSREKKVTQGRETGEQ